ncbi:MAG: protein kinase domain-containing protein [Myxococcota bacterium]
MTDDGSASQVGRVIDGRYRIAGELGSGGVGVVYRAEHLQLARPVALKLLHSEFGSSQTQVRRFEREARTLASLSHPHIVTVTDYGVVEGMPYLVMELLEGQTLQQLLKEQGALEPDRALHVTRQTLRALAFAHGQGLVHRDLKPGNIFLQHLPDAPDHVRILDFGLAKFVVGDAAEKGPALTRTGAVFGTPAYMAPEQASGDSVDTATDVYAMGVVLFEMLAGRRPFTGNMGELLKHHLLTPVPSLHQLHPGRPASPELDRFLRKSMAKQRQERFRDAGEMLAALEALPRPILSDGTTPEPTAQGDAATVPGGSGGAGTPTTTTRPAGVAPTPAERPGPKSPARVSPSRRGSLIGFLLMLVLAGGLGVGLWAWLRLGTEGMMRAAPDVPSVDRLVPSRFKGKTPPTGEWSRTVGPGGRAASESADRDPGAMPDDPWSQPMPDALARVRRRLVSGRAPSQSADRMLRAYGREHPGDPRPYLLLGQIFVKRGWRSDAVEAYELAHQRDPVARGDPRMLEDLIDLAVHPAGKVSYRARRALKRIYGQEAVPAIESRLEREGESDRAGRLRSLQASLGG